jgi:hypothetical protein
MGVYYFYGFRTEVGPQVLMNDDPWQDLDATQQRHLRHDKMLGVRFPGGSYSGYIGDISDGDDEDSDQNEESEEEVATAAGGWTRCVNTFLRMSFN